MDIIEKSSVNNVTNNTINSNFIPHALYYKIDEKNLSNFAPSSSIPVYSNSTLTANPFYEKKYFTDSTTMYDISFEENSTVTEYTTPTEYTSTEFANVTEFDVFSINSKTTLNKPKINPKLKQFCFCDLLYYECDVNCCCDEDCTTADKKMFVSCTIEQPVLIKDISFCYNGKNKNSEIASLICNANRNLPKKRNTLGYLKGDKTEIQNMKGRMFRWHKSGDKFKSTQFLGKPYIYGSLMWFMYGKDIFPIDLPSVKYNNYCNGRKHIEFLKDLKYKCIVKLEDLEMFKINQYINGSKVISIPHEDQMAASSVTCENVHCANWNVIMCDNDNCIKYNVSLHTPVCTEHFCKNVALKVEYVFHSHTFNITNATIYLHVQEISLKNQYFVQEIDVKFNLIHINSTKKNVKLSGNPGYMNDMPIIASYEAGNHSENFLNSLNNMPFIRYPININGVCLLSNRSYNVANFRNNVRNKCNFFYKRPSLNNITENCELVQKDINTLLGLNHKLFISPLGNPSEIRDEEWIELEHDLLRNLSLHGEYKKKYNLLFCNYLTTGVSYIFTYADVSDSEFGIKYRITDVQVNLKTQYDLPIVFEDGAIVITVDISFLDVSRPPVYEYAGAPKLNIHLPEDFFFPFLYSKSNMLRGTHWFMLVIVIMDFLK